MIRFTRYRWWTIGFSGLLIAVGIVFWLLGGLKTGIDFTGGSLMRVSFTERPEVSIIESSVVKAGVDTPILQPVNEHDLVLRLRPLTNDERKQVIRELQAIDPGASEVSFESIGPSIGQELRRRSVTAIIMVLAGIIVYVAWAFRNVSANSPVRSWVWASAAIIALLHDILIVIGAFAILGYFSDVEIDILFVTALLTVLGFSVHDTIVVFDRIREKLATSRLATFEETVDASINETMTRSINTSATVLFVLLALYLFGGQSISHFILALLIGIIAGAYSSIFIATPLLVVWERFRRKA